MKVITLSGIVVGVYSTEEKADAAVKAIIYSAVDNGDSDYEEEQLMPRFEMHDAPLDANNADFVEEMVQLIVNLERTGGDD